MVALRTYGAQRVFRGHRGCDASRGVYGSAPPHERRNLPMEQRYDVIILGMGPGGEVAVTQLIAAGKRVAAVERELVGGECAYWACIPSKTLLRPPEARAEAAQVAGVSTPTLDWPAAAAARDESIEHLDDSKSVQSYRDQGVTVFKGRGRITGRGMVEVNGQTLHADHVIIATGSDSAIPPITGLDDVPYWTNRQATTMSTPPRSIIIVGGGPVALEQSQTMARFGTHVTIVQSADRLIDREEPQVSDLISKVLAADGITVHLGRQVKAARRGGEGVIATLDDDTTLTAAVLLIATGRAPRVRDIGLESLGITPDEKGIKIDDQCRVTEGVWAVGDVTNRAPLTHVAQYQARVVAANILGTPMHADYRAIPRVVFTDPEIAAVGLTAQEAEEQGLIVGTATVDLAEEISRPVTYERAPHDEMMGLIADRGRGVLVGAWAVAPLAGEWLQLATVAIRAEIPLATLHDTMFQFPTFAEAFWYGVDKLYKL